MQTRGGGYNLALCAVALCVALAPSSSSAAEYVAAAAPTSLEDGKITFEYDENGAVAKLRMRPTGAETVALYGDDISFADGAKIITAQNGRCVISNALVSAGNLVFGSEFETMSWSGNLLSTTEYTTMFEGVRLDDISPVSCNMLGVSSTGGGTYLPYFVTRDGDTMRVELQAFHDKYIKAAWLELRQNGDNIEGRRINSAYCGATTPTTNYVGFSLFEHKSATVSTTDASYGIKQLTVAPRRETYDYCGSLLSDQYDTVVATNVALNELEILYGCGGHNKNLKAFGRWRMLPHHVRLSEGVLSAQFYNLSDSSFTKCVKVEFRQSGDDVVARVAYTKYVSGQGEEYDFDAISASSKTTATEEVYDSSKDMYGIDMIAMRRVNKNRLVLPVDGGRSISGNLEGREMEVTFESVPHETSSEVVVVDPLLCGTDWQTFTTSCRLGDLTIVSGRMGGRHCGYETGTDSVIVGWQNDGESASCQIQCIHSGYIKTINLYLRQNGDAVEIHGATPIYSNNANTMALLGVRPITSSDAGATTSSSFPLSTSYGRETGDKGYAVLWAGYDTASAKSYVNFPGVHSTTNYMTDSAFVFRSTGSMPLAVNLRNDNILPSGTTDAYGDTSVYMIQDAWFAYGYSSGKSAITVHSGASLYQTGTQAFKHDSQYVTIDGGTLNLRYGDSGSVSYCNFLTLSNAAYVCGTGVRFGFDRDTCWTIAGSGAVTNDCDVILFSRGSGTANNRWPSFNVEDTADGADFVVNGDIYPDTANNNAAFAKDGAGTMLVNGGISCTNVATIVNEGVLLLGKSDVFADGSEVSLCGGTLGVAAGTANAISAVSATADSGISCGAGATLTISSLTLGDDVETLAISTAGDGEYPVTIGNTLDAETLAKIRLNGKHVVQASNGRLVRRGLVISIY